MAKNPQALEFLNTRRSRSMISMSAPGPDRDALEAMLKTASRVPDHGRLVPWRFMVMGRKRLDTLVTLAKERCIELGKTEADIEKAQRQFVKSPCMVAVISSPRDTHRIPEIEQTMTAGAVCLSLVNAALATGWAPVWLSGWLSHDRTFVERAFDLAAEENVAGFIHIGTETDTPTDRPRPDMDAITTWHL